MNTVLRLRPTEKFRCVLFPRDDNITIPDGWTKSNIDSGNWPFTIVMTTPLADPLIDRLLKRVNDPLVPLISLLPDDRDWFDASGPGCWEQALAITERLEELPEQIRNSANPEDILLARLHSRGANMTASYNTTQQGMVSYAVLGGRLDAPAEAANKLVQRDCLSRSFFDRLHICPQCRGSALNVREECHACRSPQIEEEAIVHHFRCGYEGLEKTFKRSDGGLQCPQCNDMLRHIGLDYDKPGSAIECLSCNSINDTPAIGFVCMSCRAWHDAAQMPVRDWFSYKMTPAGTRTVFAGGVGELAPPSRSDTFKLILQQALRHETAFQTPFQVLKGVFGGDAATRTHNLRLASRTEDLVMDVLRSALRPVDTVTRHDNGVLILLPHMDRDGIEPVLTEIAQRMSEVVRTDPGLRFDILSRREAEQLLEEL